MRVAPKRCFKTTHTFVFQPIYGFLYSHRAYAHQNNQMPTTNLQFCLSPTLRPNRRHSIGIDKKFQSFSFFCCSLCTEKLGVFMQKKSVRLSSTIWVCKPRKWFKHFVRGTVETENSLNTHISRSSSESVSKT